MTTIILTIIGILLAAAAALMVIFYGGEAFNAGSIGAQANTYQNAGTNVISAVQLARVDGVLDLATITDPAALHSDSDPALDYLKELPTLPDGSNHALASGDYSATVGGADAAAVCTRINRNLKVGGGTHTLAPADEATTKMGCSTSADATPVYKFFANS